MALRVRCRIRRTNLAVSRSAVSTLDTDGWKWVALWVLLSLGVLPMMFGLPVSGQGRTVPAGGGSIHGAVVEEGSERPVRDAVVTLLSAQGRTLTVITDERGRYRFDGLAADGYQVSVSHDGYAAQTYSPVPLRWRIPPPGDVRVLPDDFRISGGAVWLVLADGQDRDGVNFGIVRAGRIEGRVHDADGLGVDNAIVQALFMLEDGSFNMNQQAATRTNERGDYAIAGLAPGLYRMSVKWFDPARMNAGAAIDMKPTYFPGTGILSEASPVRVESDATVRNVNIPLAPLDLYRLTGHALRGASTGSIEAQLLTPPSSTRTIRVAHDGAFELTHVPPGRHTLWARARTADGWEAAWITVELGTDMIGLVLPMMPTGAIRGRVVLENGTPLAADVEQIVAELAERDGTVLDPLPRDRTSIGSDGSFEMAGLFGTRRLTVSGNSWDVVRVIVANTPVETFSVESGERLDGIVVVVRRRSQAVLKPETAFEPRSVPMDHGLPRPATGSTGPPAGRS